MKFFKNGFIFLLILVISVSFFVVNRNKALKISRLNNEIASYQENLDITKNYLFEILPLYEKQLINITSEDYLNAQLPSNDDEKIKFCIVVPSYKNMSFINQNLNSVFKQNYHNWRMLYIDDASPDGTGDQALKIKQQSNLPDEKFSVIINESNDGSPIRAFYFGAHNFCHDDEVLVQLDGDDLLASPYVLEKLAKVYSDNMVWMTFGSFINQDHKYIGGSFEFKDEEWDSIRQVSWRSSHLRTSYTWLFKKIQLNDLTYNGKFMRSAPDLAIMFPLLEMSGKAHSRFVNDILYVYHNHQNNIGELRIKEVEEMERYIRSLPKNKLIDK